VTPRYVAIITDGNGRWAQQRGLPVLDGHRAGADVVKARLRDAVDLGVRELTVYSFSTENWSRSPGEVAGLMAMFAERIDRETPELHEEGVRMRFIGRREGVGEELIGRMEWAEDLTRANDRITMFVAFNYGGRPRSSTPPRGYEGGGEEAFRALLYAPEMHDPDLVIRTSGEQACRTTCCGSRPTPSSSSATSCGPTSTRRFEAVAGRVRRGAAALRGHR
jgi:undecaprenyl diphosphate synthase